MNKAQLINHIEHGLILTDTKFHKPVTMRLSIAQLTERLEWLRAKYKARSTKPQAPSAKCPWDAAHTIQNWLWNGGNGVDHMTKLQKQMVQNACDLVTTYSQA